jgi:PAS domain-containing protein
MQGGLPVKFENPILTKDGEERTISWSNNDILQDGVIAGTLSFGIDITERRRAVEALKISARLYRSIVADQTDFIVRWLPGGIRTFVNDAYCKYFGVTRDECIGTSLYSLIPEEWHEGVKGRIEALTRQPFHSTR